MKQATILAACIAVFHFSIAKPSYNKKIDYNKEFSNDSSAVKIIPDVLEMLDEIIKATGLQENFELKEANVLNIEASISHRKRYILYNPAYVTSLNNISKNRWSVMALLAHEVGHHLNGHTIRKGGSTPELELEADEFAGFILYKLGATLKQSQNVMYYIAKEKVSSTHPSRSSRLLAIEKGWNRASGLQETNSAIGQ